MPNLSQSELNSIREVVTAHQLVSCKYADYAQQCQDGQIKNMLSSASAQARQAAQNLIQML